MSDKKAVDYDVLIIGAGISGINAAYRIQTEAPKGTSYCILENRTSLGGTWDLFRYPGIRSDSDVFTFGFAWSPWDRKESLASGDQIKDYLTRSAKSAGIDKSIRYQHKVISADWSNKERYWTLNVQVGGDDSSSQVLKARHLLLGTGYYDYETPLQAIIPGIDDFKGKIIHPQFWPEEYDYTGKNMVIIGSGATAVTLLPSLLDRAKNVVMLQRSPTYIFPLPSQSLLTAILNALMPAVVAQFVNRAVWIVKHYIMLWFCYTFPNAARRLIRRVTESQLPPQISWDPHFNPRYKPWEQRFCASMDGDFYAALRSGRADVVTGTIDRVTADGIKLASGQELHPDVIVTATGLKLRFGGGIKFSIDGSKPIDLATKFAWKASMLQDLPNLFFLTGYENASWTLGADVSSRLFVRLLRRMRKQGYQVAVPKVPDSSSMDTKPMMSLSSTYVKTAPQVLPKGGSGQWSPKTHYLADLFGASWGDVSTDLHLE